MYACVHCYCLSFWYFAWFCWLRLTSTLWQEAWPWPHGVYPMWDGACVVCVCVYLRMRACETSTQNMLKHCRWQSCLWEELPSEGMWRWYQAGVLMPVLMDPLLLTHGILGESCFCFHVVPVAHSFLWQEVPTWGRQSLICVWACVRGLVRMRYPLVLEGLQRN